MDSKVARRYAVSLIELAKERNLTDKAFADMQLISDTIGRNRDLSLLLNNPIVNSDKKLAILTEIFGNKINELSLAFMKVITKKGREPFLMDITTEYVKLYKEQQGIKTAVVKTAIPLDDAMRSEVLQLLKKTQGEKVELSEQVDKDLIGGFILRVGDKQHDSSVSSKLRKLQQEFDDNLYVREI